MAKSPCVRGPCSVLGGLLAIGLAGCATDVGPPHAAESSTTRAAPKAPAAAPAPTPEQVGTSMPAEGLFRTALIGRRSADGKITTECVDGARAAEALRQDPSSAARPGAM
jgi:hypothetical protein